MGRKRSAVGEQLSEQISSRSGGLLRKEETGHGSVFRGALADRALNAVGARAMTVDGEVIVSETFDLVSAENQALFAHEKFHQKHSGGAAGQTIRDAEEIAARSVEAMVFHQASGGHGDALPSKLDELFEQVESGGAPTANPTSTGPSSAVTTQNAPRAEQANVSAKRGYAALRQQGFSHPEIVHLLKQMLIEEEEKQQLDGISRSGQYRGFTK